LAQPLAILSWGLGLRGYVNSGGVEDVGLYFSFFALSGGFFAVQHEADAGGVSRSHYDLAAGADGGLRGRDEGFVGDGFAVRYESDPGSFLGADQQRQGAGRLCRSGRSGHVRG